MIQPVGGCGKFLVYRILAVVLWMGAIVWLSLTPAQADLEGLLGWDKLQHAAAYGLLAFLAGRVFSSLCRNPIRAWSGALFFAITLGLGLEIAQELFTAGRRADPADVLANSIGALAGCAIALIPLRRNRGKRAPPEEEP